MFIFVGQAFFLFTFQHKSVTENRWLHRAQDAAVPAEEQFLVKISNAAHSRKKTLHNGTLWVK